jgi:DivIVA domain-containing protein
MRPPTGARPAARDTSTSVGPRSSSRRRRARHTRSSGAQTHTEWSAPPQSLGVRVPERTWYRWRTRVQAGTSGDEVARRCGVSVDASSRRSCFPARRLGAGRPCPLPRVAHHRLGGVARRRLARERRRAGSCAELLLGGRPRLGRLLTCPAVGRPDCGDRSLPAVLRGPAGRSRSCPTRATGLEPGIPRLPSTPRLVMLEALVDDDSPQAGERESELLTPKEIRNVSFPGSVRGYDRSAVDAYVTRVNRVIAELQVRSSPRAAVRHALEQVGEQTSGILQRAREAAEEITASARQEAGRDHRPGESRGGGDRRQREYRGRSRKSRGGPAHRQGDGRG